MFKYTDLQQQGQQDGLKPIHRHFAFLYYQERKNREQIMGEMHISRRSYYRYRKTVSRVIRVAYIGTN